MKISDEVIFIGKYFETFFSANCYVLNSSSPSEIVFENKCSNLTFHYETRYGMDFEEISYENKQTKYSCRISRLIEFLYPSITFATLLESYTGPYGHLKMTDIEAYSLIIEKHLGKIIATCDFSWEEDFKKWLAQKKSW